MPGGDADMNKERLCRLGEPDVADVQILHGFCRHVVDDEKIMYQRQPAKSNQCVDRGRDVARSRHDRIGISWAF